MINKGSDAKKQAVVAKKLLPKRKSTDNKTAGGKCLVIAGHKNMFGAAVLAATAAARVGAGYVYLMIDIGKFEWPKHPDFILQARTSQKFLGFDSIAIGPALGVNTASLRILRSLVKAAPASVVVDADALTLIAKHNISKLPSTWVLTPHEGELARLIEKSSVFVNANRRIAVEKAQKKFGCIVLLKGAETLIASKNRITILKVGNSALAKAGTGDVLTGMIAGFMAQKLFAEDAAWLAAFIHGRCADDWVRDKDHLSLMASDLLDTLPKIIFKVRNSSG